MGPGVEDQMGPQAFTLNMGGVGGKVKSVHKCSNSLVKDLVNINRKLASYPLGCGTEKIYVISC